MRKACIMLFLLGFICQALAFNNFLEQNRVELTPEQKEEYYRSLEDGRNNDFNPLGIGYYWVYHCESWPDTWYYRPRIIKSQLVNDSLFFMKSYRHNNGGIIVDAGYWSKNVDDTTIIWDSLHTIMEPFEADFILDEDFNVTATNYEDAIDVYHSMYVSGATTPFKCLLIEQGFIEVWGILTEYKYLAYNHPEVIDLYHTLLWARGFGALSMINEWGGFSLQGCVIDGVVYGDTTVTAVEEITLPEIPQIKISSSPNPFRTNTLISYELPTKADDAEIQIYNTKGQLIRKERLSGKGVFDWDARDSFHNQVSSGIYLIRIKTDKQQAVRKAIFIK
ncbi:MAG: T9SS type A sorting domain-containing protein [Candidatus Cloacimonetes bacterium]|nr:T9SS type A sorting domain-containing protein [Candidatus Cloacimonadota bacterium]